MKAILPAILAISLGLACAATSFLKHYQAETAAFTREIIAHDWHHARGRVAYMVIQRVIRAQREAMIERRKQQWHPDPFADKVNV